MHEYYSVGSGAACTVAVLAVMATACSGDDAPSTDIDHYRITAEDSLGTSTTTADATFKATPSGDPCATFVPGADWCADCGPCPEGQGDCDGDAECEPGLICAQDVGANYGWPASRDVCEAPGGGDPCATFVPGADWCADCGPCPEGQGDCDGDAECEPGLICAQDVGANYGWPASRDVCEAPGGGDPCATFVPGADWCADCGPCPEGQGDCDGDAECEPGLICAQDVGANYGWPASRDVCELDGGGGDPCATFQPGPDWCSDCGPCPEGQGDCDGDAECEPGLICAQNVGANYGWPASRDVCEAPGGGDPCATFVPGADWCADCGPCPEGQGDCDGDAECEPGLICAQDVGANYGWPPTRDVCVLDDGGDPSIDVWYGDTQSFGVLGNPQWWVNVLGQVDDPDGVSQLTYSLNGAAARGLSRGPWKRLAQPGDFNIEIDYLELLPGLNTVEIRAVDGLGFENTKTVDLQYTPGTVWPLGYQVDWSSVLEIGDAAQLVDGRWSIDGGELRNDAYGYDRAVAIGDITWTDYEVTIPVTAHSYSPEGFEPINSRPAFGVMLKWPGHTNRSGEQPSLGYWPSGGGGWYAFNSDGSGRLWLTDFLGQVGKQRNRPLTLGTTYMWKVRVESQSDGSALYSLKVWEEGSTEPVDWDIVDTDSDDVPGGGVLLVAHFTDVSFGNIVIEPL